MFVVSLPSSCTIMDFFLKIFHYAKKENYNLSSADYKYKSAKPIFDELFLKQNLTRLAVHVEHSI